jgi:hypothetical protein
LNALCVARSTAGGVTRIGLHRAAAAAAAANSTAATSGAAADKSISILRGVRLESEIRNTTRHCDCASNRQHARPENATAKRAQNHSKDYHTLQAAVLET